MTLNVSYDIPYLSGYSKDGKTVYIDREMPKEDSGYPLWAFLIVHEVVEKSMLDTFHCGYELAHKIATEFEKFFVLALGLNWEKEDAIMQKYVKTAGHEKIRRAPKELDMTPYVDEEDETALSHLEQAQAE